MDSEELGPFLDFLRALGLSLPQQSKNDDGAVTFILDAVPNLRHLRLEWMVPEAGKHLGYIFSDTMSPTAMLNFLSRCPNLDTLSLYRLYDSPFEHETDPLEQTIISLPRLHHLGLQSLEEVWTIRLARGIYATAVDTIRLDCEPATSDTMLEVLFERDTGLGTSIRSLFHRHCERPGQTHPTPVRMDFISDDDESAVHYSIVDAHVCKAELIFNVGRPITATTISKLADLKLRTSTLGCVDIDINDAGDTFAFLSQNLGQYDGLGSLHLQTTLEASEQSLS